MKFNPQTGSTRVRLLTAVVVAPVVFVLALAPALHYGFVALAAVLAAVGVWEYLRMAQTLDVEIWPAPAMLCAGALVVFSGMQPPLPTPNLLAATMLSSVGLGVAHMLFGRHTLTGLAVSCFGVVYVGLGSAHLVLLKQVHPLWLAFLLVVIILSDTGAYFIGRAVGRRKFAPKVSPKKTWEGAVGGMGAAALGAALFGVALRAFSPATLAAAHIPSPGVCALFAVFAALAGQLGDLVESMLKRDAGIKDSGTLFPGHGGVLDRCDGFLFAAPVLFYCVVAGV